MTTHHSPTVALLGLGSMGAALAQATLSAGHPTVVWNRTARRAEALTAAGATAAVTPEAALESADVVIACLLDPASVRETLEVASGAVAGRTIVNLTSGTPEEGRALAAWVRAQGGRYVDGAIMAVPEQIGTTTGFILLSGDVEAAEQHRSLLEQFAPLHVLGEDAGAAEEHNLALLGTGYGALTGFLHATALMRAAGVPATQFAVLAQTWLGGIAEFMTDLAGEIDRRDYAGGASSVVDQPARDRPHHPPQRRAGCGPGPARLAEGAPRRPRGEGAGRRELRRTRREPLD